VSLPAALDPGPTMGRRLAVIVGAVVTGGGVAMIPAIVAALWYREWSHAAAIGEAAVISAVVGLVAWRGFGRTGELTTRQGFAAVGVSWIAMICFGTLPYLFTGAIPGPTDAFFETAAGFTTTGATVIDPGGLSHGLLMWRATTQWVGGMGIIVLSVAVLPLLGVGGVQLARAEAPGPEPDRLTPRFRETARRLWMIYVVLTLLEALLLALGEMTAFEAIAHAFTTISTGGFSTEAGSIGAFGPYTQWVVIGFMYVSGISFALHFRALRRPAVYAGNTEFRLYTGIILVAAGLIIGGLWLDGLGGGGHVRDAAFSAVTLVTGTGYVTADFGAWIESLQVLAVGLMFVGGMAGSTAGAVKTFRIGVMTTSSLRGLKRLVYPNAVVATRWNGRPVADSVLRSIQQFFLFYVFLFAAGAFLLALFQTAFGPGTDLVTATSAAASALGNVGPGLGEVGPAGSYVGLVSPAKWLLAFLMVMGRLEIFPVVLLFTRHLWRR
jgi:trk system potassium uptake protein TrkH